MLYSVYACVLCLCIGDVWMELLVACLFFFFQAEDGIRDLVRSRGLGDVYKRQASYGVIGIEPYVSLPILPSIPLSAHIGVLAGIPLLSLIHI